MPFAKESACLLCPRRGVQLSDPTATVRHVELKLVVRSAERLLEYIFEFSMNILLTGESHCILFKF